MKDAGYQVVCFAPEDTATPQLTDEGIEVHPIRHLSRKGTNPVQDIRLIRELTALYRFHNIDLVVHFTIKPNIYGSLAARRAGIPSMAVVTGLGFTFLSSGLASRAARQLYRYAFRQNQLTIFQNPDDRALFIQRNLVDPDRSAVVLGSGIDTDFFTPDESLPDSPVYVFIGRLLHDKGIRELLDGFTQYQSKHPEARLVIVGEPDPDNPASIAPDELQRYSRHEGIDFAGFQSDIRSFIRQASAVVLPSYREGVPRTLLEALSMSRPVITTDVPGCREVVVPGENGLMVPCHDPARLARAFEEFHALDGPVKQQMGQRSRKLAEEVFSTKVVNKQYLAWVERVING